MRNISIVTIVLAAIFSCSFQGCSQGKANTQSKGTPPPPASTRPPLKQVGRAQAHFSASLNSSEGVVIIDILDSRTPTGNYGLSMMAHFSVPGPKIVKPKNIYLGFDSNSPKRQYKDNRRLSIVCDGKDCLSVDTRIMHVEESETGANETLKSAEIGFEDFVRITKSQKIIVKLGSTSVELKRSDIEALRDLVRLAEEH